MTTGSEDAIELAESVIENEPDREMIRDIEKAKTRMDFARVAAQISEDRYGAGSTAARVAIYIMLVHGHEAAIQFAEDIQHHEGF